MKFLFITVIVFLIFDCISAQDIKWKRSTSRMPELMLFHSTHAISLPTGETLQQGDFEFEISHRFVPLVKEGYDAFWGLDGPANIRIALGYAIYDYLLVTLGRSNVYDNLDLQVRYKMFQIKNDILPSLVTANFGLARNKQISDRSRNTYRNFQYFVQVIYNTLIIKKIGIGLVPAYLYNSALYTDTIKHSLTMGTYVQYYISQNWSIIIEWNPTVIGWRDSFNSISAGIELETGGHFFKFFVTNNDLINNSHFLAGADKKSGDLRLGFMITRLL